MNSLSVENINTFSPYTVWGVDDVLFFKTEHDVEYSVDFDKDEIPEYDAYWLNLNNLNKKPSPNDVKVPQTVICIIEEFFDKNPDILLYMCSRYKDQQAQRARLFLRWFNGYKQREKYLIKSVDVRGEGLMEYVAMIVPRTHPNIDAISQRFDEEVAMFNDMKP